MGFWRGKEMLTVRLTDRIASTVLALCRIYNADIYLTATNCRKCHPLIYK